jgi:L-arabinokinase
MQGYLANLDPDDYKQFFRPQVPESMAGREFLERYGPTADPITGVEPEVSYAVRHATDHHVLEARRVRRFVEFLEKAGGLEGRARGLALDSAGHLMYASHQSYTMDAMLGAEECDLLVAMLRRREPAGLYGARITAGGSGGTVAVLADASDRADRAIADAIVEYNARTGLRAELFSGTSPGAWHVGTAVV